MLCPEPVFSYQGRVLATRTVNMFLLWLLVQRFGDFGSASMTSLVQPNENRGKGLVWYWFKMAERFIADDGNHRAIIFIFPECKAASTEGRACRMLLLWGRNDMVISVTWVECECHDRFVCSADRNISLFTPQNEIFGRAFSCIPRNMFLFITSDVRNTFLVTTAKTRGNGSSD